MIKHRLAMAVLLVSAASATAQQPPQGNTPRPADPALAAVPTDSFLFVSVKVSKLWDNPAAKPVRDWVATQTPNPFDNVVGLNPADVDRVTLFVPGLGRNSPVSLVLVTTRQAYNEAKVLKALGTRPAGDAVGRPAAGRVAEVDGMFRWVAFLDDRTMLFLPREIDDEQTIVPLIAQLVLRKPDGPLAAALLTAQTHDVTVGVDLRTLEAAFPAREARELAPYLVLLKARTATLTADVGKTAKGQFVMAFPDAGTAKRAAPVLEEGLKTLTEVFNDKDGEAARLEPAGKMVYAWGVSVLKNAKVTAVGADVVATADVEFADDLAKFVTVLPKSLQLARSTIAAQNNLKQLALSLHNFESANAVFPGDVTVGGAKGPAVSWRVQVLPYIEQANLFQQLDMTRAWDDPVNLKRLEAMEMPKVFEHPGRPAPKGHTYFRIFSLPKGAKGADRPFLTEGERGPRVADMTDGLSNTFMIVEAGEAVPWYKPDVLPYDGKLPLPALGDKAAETFLAAMGDGSVRVIRKKIDEPTLRALITRSGGEVIPNIDR